MKLHGLCLSNSQSVNSSDLVGRNVLDIGCGNGWFELCSLARGVEAITGVDISETDLRTARTHVRDARASFHVGSAIALPFDNASFDTVVSWEVLEHIPKGTEPQMFQEVRRVLRPGGVFYLSTPQATVIGNALDPAWWLIGHRHYTKRALGRLAEQARFRVEVIRSVGGAWTIATVLNMYIAKWIFRRPIFMQKMFNERMDAEFRKASGFSNLFLKCVSDGL